jgi:RND family efflux transporter MFP subunit
MIRRHLQWFVFFTALILLAVTVMTIQHRIEAQAARPAAPKKIAQQHPAVSVVTVQSGSYNAQVTAYGATSPHFELTLTAQVAGQVDRLASNFEAGYKLKKADAIVFLEGSDYRAQVAAAKKNLSDARLMLLEEEREALQAKTEWETSGMKGAPASALVLRQPQLEAATAAVAKAEADLVSARRDLNKTRIVAPFDALVVQRHISPGSYLQAGTPVATLYSTDRVEIAVSLPADDWTKLPETAVLNSGQWPAALSHVQNGEKWNGRILRAQHHLDASTRQRGLILALDHPLDSDPPLLPGTFVKATIPGRRLENLWELPGSALSQKGEIWYVQADHTLASFPAKPLFNDGDVIYVSVPDTLKGREQKVLVHPLNSYLAGMRVDPVREAGHE